MRYIKIQFTDGLSGFGYQEIDANGNCIRILDEKGSDIAQEIEKQATGSVWVEDDVLPPFSTETFVDPSIERDRLAEESRQRSIQETGEQIVGISVEELDERIRQIVNEQQEEVKME